jgi:predicted nucleotidyltransferase
MSVVVTDDPVLTRFRQAVRDAYGSKLERVVLFGSRARGDHHAESDYDIAVFIHEPDSFNTEAARVARIVTQILYDTGEVVNPAHFQAGAYLRETGFMTEVRRDGIDL